MEFPVVEDGDVRVLEREPDQPFMSRVEDANRVLEACFSMRVRAFFGLVACLLTAGFIAWSGPSVGAGDPLTVNDGSAPARIELSRDLHLRLLRKDVVIVTHACPWPANSLVAEMANSDVVFVGTPYTPTATREVLKWMDAAWGKRNVVAIDTGYHVDNLGGNEALIERGIPVYGSDRTVELLRQRGEQSRKVTLGMLTGDDNKEYYKVHSELPFVAPTRRFPLARGLRLTFGSEQVQVYYPGPSQAPDKVVVYFPSKKVLFGGCMILGGDRVGNTADADLRRWPDAVRKLTQFDATIVVPGHGDRLDAGLIQHTIDLLTMKR